MLPSTVASYLGDPLSPWRENKSFRGTNGERTNLSGGKIFSRGGGAGGGGPGRREGGGELEHAPGRRSLGDGDELEPVHGDGGGESGDGSALLRLPEVPDAEVLGEHGLDSSAGAAEWCFQLTTLPR
jgi:hypothetical protein